MYENGGIRYKHKNFRNYPSDLSVNNEFITPLSASMTPIHNYYVFQGLVDHWRFS
jgi:hypothetical protein